MLIDKELKTNMSTLEHYTIRLQNQCSFSISPVFYIIIIRVSEYHNNWEVQAAIVFAVKLFWLMKQ